MKKEISDQSESDSNKDEEDEDDKDSESEVEEKVRLCSVRILTEVFVNAYLICPTNGYFSLSVSYLALNENW